MLPFDIDTTQILSNISGVIPWEIWRSGRNSGRLSCSLNHDSNDYMHVLNPCRNKLNRNCRTVVCWILIDSSNAIYHHTSITSNTIRFISFIPRFLKSECVTPCSRLHFPLRHNLFMKFSLWGTMLKLFLSYLNHPCRNITFMSQLLLQLNPNEWMSQFLCWLLECYLR